MHAYLFNCCLSCHTAVFFGKEGNGFKHGIFSAFPQGPSWQIYPCFSWGIGVPYLKGLKMPLEMQNIQCTGM